MRNTTAFLVLLGCLSGGAQAQSDAIASAPKPSKTDSQYADGGQPCAAPAPVSSTSTPDPSAPQNQIEYGG